MCVHSFRACVHNTHLIFVDFTVLQFSLALLLERDDDQGNEYVNEEKRKHDEINDVEQWSLNVVIRYRSLVFLSGGYRVL